MPLTPIDIEALPLTLTVSLSDTLVSETTAGTRAIQLQVLRDAFAGAWSALTNLPTTPPPTTPAVTTPAVTTPPPTTPATTTPPPTTGAGEYYLSVNGGQPGISAAAGSGSYAPGTVVNVEAFFFSGYVFNTWSDDVGGLQSAINVNPNTYLMPAANRTITPTATLVATTPPPTTPPPTTPPPTTGALVTTTLASNNTNTPITLNIDLDGYGVSRFESIEVTCDAFGEFDGVASVAGTVASSQWGSDIGDSGFEAESHGSLIIGPITKVGSDWIADISGSAYSMHSGTNSGGGSAVNLGPSPVQVTADAFSSSIGGGFASRHKDIKISYYPGI